jgi:hypothetical protein
VGCSPLERNQFVPISIPMQGIRDINTRHALDAVRKSLQSVAQRTMTWMNLSGFWAKITGAPTGGKHPWISVEPNSSGAFAAPTYQPMTSADPGLDLGIEENGITTETLTDRIVWMKPRITSDGNGLAFFFAVPMTSGTPSGSITVTRTNEDGTTTTFNNVTTLNVSNQSGFDGDQSGGTVNLYPNEAGPDGGSGGGSGSFVVNQSAGASAPVEHELIDLGSRGFVINFQNGDVDLIDNLDVALNGVSRFVGSSVALPTTVLGPFGPTTAGYTFQVIINASGKLTIEYTAIPAGGVAHRVFGFYQLTGSGE